MSKNKKKSVESTENTTEFKIENAVRPPMERAGHCKYPFAQLEVSTLNPDGEIEGPSFLVPGRTVKSFSAQAYAAARRTGCKFSCRAEKDSAGTVTGVRVWRVE